MAQGHKAVEAHIRKLESCFQAFVLPGFFFFFFKCDSASTRNSSNRQQMGVDLFRCGMFPVCRNQIPQAIGLIFVTGKQA